MAIKPKCDVGFCRQELTEYGAILFGPPEELADGSCKKEVDKLHICAECYFKVLRFMQVDQEFMDHAINKIAKSRLRREYGGEG